MLTREQRIGAFFIVGLLLLFVAIELTLGLGLFKSRYPLYASFRDVQGLDTGADVLLAGIKVGRVADLKIVERQVKIRMMIDHGFEVKRDSVARLDFRALSGERFVAISLGSPTAPTAKPGDTIDGETPATFAAWADEPATAAATASGPPATPKPHPQPRPRD